MELPTRQNFGFTRTELRQWNRLRPIPGEARLFWDCVAVARNLDPESIIADNSQQDVSFTGLLKGHNKHWCFPAPLKMKTRVEFKD